MGAEQGKRTRAADRYYQSKNRGDVHRGASYHGRRARPDPRSPFAFPQVNTPIGVFVPYSLSGMPDALAPGVPGAKT